VLVLLILSKTLGLIKLGIASVIST